MAGESRARLDLAEAPTRHPYVLDVAQPDTEAVLAELVADTADPQLLRRHLAGALHLREPSTA
ncbi:hypothetical protein ACLFMI_23635 [Pseudonocardia nantongensis]|uniref:hypothetical protein n=1 Tax=Pseudonocardia nantongensis TaxID=1181885 RepID=UPI00397E25FB